MTKRDIVTLALDGRPVPYTPLESAKIETLELGEYVTQYGSRDLLLWLELIVGRRTISTNFVSLARPKHLELPPPGISTSVEATGEKTFRVTLKAKQPALWTWLEVQGTDSCCSDNFFHLRPGKQVSVEVTTARKMTVAQFRQKLAVRSLVDTYR